MLKECNEPLFVADLEVIPRIDETITLPVKEGGETYRVRHVDYLIKEKKNGWIRVWVS